MLRFTFPYLFFVSLTAFAGGILNTYGRFGVPAFTPVLLNLCLIAAALYAISENLVLSSGTVVLACLALASAIILAPSRGMANDQPSSGTSNGRSRG